MKELNRIQRELKAPKNLFNKFGNYSYRSAEGILEAVKPILGGCVLTITDEIVEIGGRVYVKATVILSDVDGGKYEVSAYAREPESKKGMDESQITGAASSYARKYALNGLFLIDDVKDADATNTHDSLPELTPSIPAWDKAKQFVENGGLIEEIEKKYYISPENKKLLCGTK